MPHQSDLDLIMLKLSGEAYKLADVIIMQFYPSVTKSLLELSDIILVTTVMRFFPLMTVHSVYVDMFALKVAIFI